MNTDMLAHVKAGRVIRLFGWLNLIGGILLLIAMIVPLIASGNASAQQIVQSIVMGIIIVAIGWLQLLLGNGVKQHKEWARVIGIIYGALSLLGIPIGTIVGIYILYCLIKKWDITLGTPKT